MGVNRALARALSKGFSKMAKPKKPLALNMTKLAAVINAGPSGGYFQPSDDLTALQAAGYIETNPAGASAEHGLPARATDAGRAALAAQQPAAPPSTPPPPAFGAAPVAAAPAAAAATPSAFKLVAGVPVPEAKRKGGLREATYPFAQMEVGQSFFVGPSAAMPEPWKQLTSTVSSATRRFATLNGAKTIQRRNKTTGLTETKQIDNYVPTKKFEIRHVDGAPWGYPGVVGAGIYRTA